MSGKNQEVIIPGDTKPFTELSSIDKDLMNEIENPKFFCAQCGAGLWNLNMILYKRNIDRGLGYMPKIKQGFYVCLNHTPKKFKCLLYEYQIPAKELERRAKQNEINEKVKEGFNALLDEIEKMKGE
jgi:hypothetical protein